jgi:transcriptional regulator with XRE-family HTH domain
MNGITKTFLSASQIRAARALLGWSQDDLAEAATISAATIRKLELGHISPRPGTTQVIRQAFEDAGLEFIEPDGVRRRPGNVMIYEGIDGFAKFFDDVYQTTKRKSCEIVVVCASEVPFDKAFDGTQPAHLQRMAAIRDQVSVKCILTEDISSLPAVDYCEYRLMSKHYVDSVPFYVYDDKYAIIVFEADPSPKITVIQSHVVAEAFRRQFYSMWEKAAQINKKTDNVVDAQKKFLRK